MIKILKAKAAQLKQKCLRVLLYLLIELFN